MSMNCSCRHLSRVCFEVMLNHQSVGTVFAPPHAIVMNNEIVRVALHIMLLGNNIPSRLLTQAKPLCC